MRAIFKKGSKYIIVFSLFAAAISPVLSFTRQENNISLKEYYLERIGQVKKYLLELKQSSVKKEPLFNLKKKFLRSRLAYKKMAVISEYFNRYESKLLNGPALDWSGEDTPDKINHPEGLQVIEQLLYSDWKGGSSYNQLNFLLQSIMHTLLVIEQDRQLLYKFKDELVWDAIRSASLRLFTVGITGYDSPLAKYSLPEAIATIEEVKSLLACYQKNKGLVKNIDLLYVQLDKALSYLQAHSNFDTFDRLIFINEYMNPFYKQLNHVRLLNDIRVPAGANPVNFSAESIFDTQPFDINFFSPAKEYRMTREKVALGKKLFSDSILSGTKTRSCAGCHQAEKAFTDGLKTPLSIIDKLPLLRNTPTLWNSVFQSRQFFDGRADILENQLDDVVHNEKEMHGSLKEAVRLLNNSGEYKELFKKAYPGEPVSITVYTIANAVASYVRSLSGFGSRFDLYMRGDSTKLNISEKTGFSLFMGKAKCATCHHPPLFNGLLPPEFEETESEVLGVPATTATLNAKLDSDLGKYLFTRSAIHKYSFKTPTIRNIELTAPYMHNGVFKTLEEVMAFYNKGGGKGLKIAPGNQTLSFDKLNLSKKEQTDIINFMKSLTDNLFVSTADDTHVP